MRGKFSLIDEENPAFTAFCCPRGKHTASFIATGKIKSRGIMLGYRQESTAKPRRFPDDCSFYLLLYRLNVKHQTVICKLEAMLSRDAFLQFFNFVVVKLNHFASVYTDHVIVVVATRNFED